MSAPSLAQQLCYFGEYLGDEFVGYFKWKLEFTILLAHKWPILCLYYL